MDIIKVSGKSRTSAVAGAIAGVVRESKHAVVQAIGASAVNQAVKAMALAKSYLVKLAFLTDELKQGRGENWITRVEEARGYIKKIATAFESLLHP